MLAYFILGLGLLMALLLFAGWYTSTDTRQVLKTLKWTGFGLILLTILLLVLSGRISWALMAVPVLLPWIIRIRSLARAAKTFSRMSGQGADADQVSDVKTPSLHMSLDHRTGEMTGQILSGQFSGNRLEDLALPDLMVFLQDCMINDRDAARLLESYLDRRFRNWRETQSGADQNQNTGSGSAPRSAPGSAMDRREAHLILGLEEGADDRQIHDAHRRLISQLHPDHGGSDYLAAKINQAKDFLLKG